MKVSIISLAAITAVAAGFGTSQVSGNSVFTPFDSPTFCSQIITPSCNTTLSYIDAINENIRPYVSSLVKTPYFKYFKVNFDKQCKFWDAQHFCATANCAVEILDDYHWTNLSPQELGKINTEEVAEAETCEDLDYTHIDDDHNCVYVNLLDNPERFTGYGGAQSFDVWRAIYAENCFPNTNPMSMDGGKEEECVEKNLFTRIVSGMHASIGVHLSNEYLDADGTEFYPNLKIFMERVGYFNDRLSNIYFNYALLSQAVIRLSEIVNIEEFIKETGEESDFAREFGSGASASDNTEAKALSEILPVLSQHTLFNTSTLFDPKNVSPNLKNEFRARFKNISAIMDCVGCDRCRMWGKLQTIGYGTALKVLFDGEDVLKFRRIEIVALFNTFDRLSKSIVAINNFKVMYIKHMDEVSQGIAKPGDFSTGDGFSFPFISENKRLERIENESKIVIKTDANREKAQKPQKVELPITDKPRTPPKFKKLPTKKIPVRDPEVEKLIHPELRLFTDECWIAYDEVYSAFKFVVLSYKDFPVHVFRLGVYYASSGWDRLIGAPKKYEYHSEFGFDQNVL